MHNVFVNLSETTVDLQTSLQIVTEQGVNWYPLTFHLICPHMEFHPELFLCLKGSVKA